MDVIGWRAWYPGGTTLSSRRVAPEHLPEGVIGIVVYYDRCTTCKPRRHYREVIVSGDYYIHDADRWTHVPTHPIPGRWVERADVEALYPGSTIIASAPGLPDTEWENLRQRMLDEVAPP